MLRLPHPPSNGPSPNATTSAANLAAPNAGIISSNGGPEPVSPLHPSGGPERAVSFATASATATPAASGLRRNTSASRIPSAFSSVHKRGGSGHSLKKFSSAETHATLPGHVGDAPSHPQRFASAAYIYRATGEASSDAAGSTGAPSRRVTLSGLDDDEADHHHANHTLGGGGGDDGTLLDRSILSEGGDGGAHATVNRRQSFAPVHKPRFDAAEEESIGNGSDSDNDTASVMSGASNASTNASTPTSGTWTLRCAGYKFRIPFTVWTFLAMFVPIVLLVGVLSSSLALTVNELDVLHEHNALAAAVGECSSWLMRERGTMGPWLARGLPSDADALATVRTGADRACAGTLFGEQHRLAVRAGEGSDTWRAEVLSLSHVLGDLAAWRSRVDGRAGVNGRAARDFFTSSIAQLGQPLIIVADQLRQSARSFTELQMLITTRNFIGLARGIGNAIAASDPNATSAAAPVVQEYIGGHAQARVSLSILRRMADPTLRRKLAEWSEGALAVKMWRLLDTMADVAGGGVGAIQRDNATEWWPAVSAGLDALSDVESAHLERLRAATEATVEVRDSGLIMGLGVLACVVAGGLLAWQQSRVRRQLEDQVSRIERTRAAVSAFVPRFFLHKMGYTSITQVRAGESTNVALAMLFSDIRRFTTVSEGMQSSELFDWVQGYFQRMTSIVEGRRGNVNQFIGDAMFAVFSTCNDSLQCAVDMQADVQQLNVQRLCEDESIIPIEVGVGIHHDVVALGILGDTRRHTCTAISASVNLASRLEGLTKQLGCKIIASEAVVSQLSRAEAGELRMRRLGPVVVKGAVGAAPIYEVYQTDERALQQYKRATSADVATVIDAILDGSAPIDVAERLRDAVSEGAAVATAEARRRDSGGSVPAADAVTSSSDATHTGGAPAERTPSHAAAADPATDIGASLGRVCDALRRYGVTDAPLVTIASMPLGSRVMTFDSK